MCFERFLSNVQDVRLLGNRSVLGIIPVHINTHVNGDGPPLLLM